METFNDPSESLEMRLKSWSHSRLVVGEACLRHAELKFIAKIPEPERPLPPGKTEHANDRGTRLHEAAEMHTKGGVELVHELKRFEKEHIKLRELHAAGMVSTEGDWAYTKSWEPVAWMSSDAWCRIKCDAVVFTADGTEAVVIDFKSGKRWGNEIKHGEQMQLYVIGVLLRYPKIKKVTAELWYWDQDMIAKRTYTREQGLKFVPNFERRGTRITTVEEFPPNPSIHVCRWCPYKPVAKGGTGHCSVGM